MDLFSIFSWEQRLQTLSFSPKDIDKILGILRPALSSQAHGNIPLYLKALDKISATKPTCFSITRVEHDGKTFDAVETGVPPDDTQSAEETTLALRTLMPWRKGPFLLAGVFIDTEWRSDLKWNRISPFLPPLKDKSILDIGCGSGYHLFRMLEAGASEAIGLEPYLLSVVQHLAVSALCHETRNIVLPLSLEQFCPGTKKFDIVFSMGVIYHRPDPIDHLQRIMDLLADGGTLVLETLVIDSDKNTGLKPLDRYAKMRNIHILPCVSLVMEWLKKSGFIEIRRTGTFKTTSEEQRKTQWMQFESLADFLDPDDPSKTIEGYPAPCRAFFIAKKKAVQHLLAGQPP
jgi:tRNA (mo5U34)-methyltransferase